MNTIETSRRSGVPALSLLFAGIILTACGTNSIQTVPTVTEGLTAASTDTTATSTSSSGGSVTVSTVGDIPPVQLTVEGLGYNPVTVSVSTRSVLEVEWQPGVQDQAIAGSNFEPQYSMLGVYITVGSNTQPTDMVTNGYNGTTAETSQILDFSSYIPSNSSGTVNIVVSQPNYDYDCLNYQLFCYPVPWMHVEATHPWNGTLLVQTDSTSALQ